MLTRLEQAVIDMLLDRQGEPFDAIRQQLSHAMIAERRFTGVGFFTDFVIPTDAPVRRDLADMTIGEVGANLPGLQHGAGFLLFIRGGVVSMLEGYTYDESWPASTDEFTVHRHQAAQHMVAIQQIPNRTIWVWAVLAAVAALSLSLLHPLFALGSGFLCAYVSYCAFDAVSRNIFGKEFQPPLKIPTPEWDTTRKWSDWVLLAPFIVVFVFLLFGFGEIADCLGGQDFWKSGWSLCSY